MDYVYYIAGAIVAVIVIWVLFAKVLKNKKPGNSLKDLPLDIQELVNAFGGKDNIKNTEANGSKIYVYVNEDDLVKPAALKELGASGIIQSTGKVTVIMGKYSTEIAQAMNNL